MELRQYISIIWRWLWLIVLATGVAGVSTYLATRDTPPTYQTKTTVMVGQVTEEINPTNMDFYAGQRLAETYAQLIRREPVMRATVDALGLAPAMSWQGLAGRVSATVVEGTQLIEITVTDGDPVRVQVLANEVARQLILQSPTTPSAEEQQHQAFMQEQLTDLEGKINAARAKIKELEAESAAATSARQMQDLQGQIAVLQNQVAGWQTNYAQLMNLVNHSNINYLSVVEPATPVVQVGPQVMRNVMLATAVGLVLALAAVFLLEYLDDTIKTAEDVTRTANLPALGAIARIEGKDYPTRLVAALHPLSPIAEAYRVLRTNIQFSAVDKPLRTLMVTSPGPTEGKSVTLANLAVVMAQSGLKVIAVDSDLRRPVLHKLFGLSNSHGLTNTIVQPNPGLAEHLKATDTPNLWVLCSGPLPPNPAEVVGSERMKAIIEELKGRADVVLFDSPPTLVVADAAILSSRVDGVLLVNDAGSTRRSEARQSADELRRVGANLLGAVLNRLSSRRGGYYYYYYYYQREDGAGRKRRRRRSWLQRWLPFRRSRRDEPETQVESEAAP